MARRSQGPLIATVFFLSDPVIVAPSEGSADDDESSVAGDFAIQIAKSRIAFTANVEANARPATAKMTDAEAEAEADGEEARSPVVIPAEPDASIEQYFQLRRELVLITLALTALVVGSVWFTYGINIALNYLIGACTGLIYLNMLAKHVGQLGRQRARLGNSRLALLVGVILIASRVNQLEILPIFLGFLTYKAALMVYVLRSVITSD